MSRPRHMRIAWIGGVALACSVAYTGWIGVDPEPAAPSQPAPQTAKAHPPGFWVKAPEARRVDAAEHEWISRLEAIGYLPGVEETDDPREVGVTLRTPGASAAPRLYVSGHAPEATLIDVEGRILHRWRFAPDRIWKDVSPERAHSMANFRRAYLLAGGELLAIVEGVGILKLDRDSNLLWQRRNGAHHAAHPLPDGRILVLTRSAHVVPAIDPERPILEDFIVELNADGDELRRVSIVEALLRSDYASLAREPHPDLPPRNRPNVEAGDIHHTNSIQQIQTDHPTDPGLRRGYVLVSSLHLSAVMAVDLDSHRVTWLRRGDFLVQHEASLLPNGNLLLFDNHTGKRGSRALELSASGEPVWQYPPPGSPERIYSSCCGTVARLPNGNTLLAATEAGRAIEVTPGHELVWEFRTPHRTGGRRELMAALFSLTPVPENMDLAWARGDRAFARASR